MTSMTPAVGGPAVEVVAENVPAGISKRSRRGSGVESSLANLALLVEDDTVA